MKNRIKFVPLLLSSPLLVANSPAPYPNTCDYKDVEVSATLLEELDNEYKYQLDIKNKGSLYPFIDRGIRFNGTLLYASNVTGLLFDNEALSINDTKTVYITSDRKIDTKEDGEWSLEAFEIQDDNVTFENSSITYVSEFGELYKYKFNSDVSNLGDHYYSAVIEIDYDGDAYAFAVNLNRSTSDIFTFEQLDLSKITIKKITAFRSSYGIYRNNFLNALITFFGWAALTLFVFIPVGLVIVSAAIVIPIVVSKKRKKDKAISK